MIHGHFGVSPVNNSEASPLPSPIIFQEWTDTRTFSDLKYTSTKINCILKDIVHFIFVHRDKNVNRLHVLCTTIHSCEIMDIFIMAKYFRCILIHCILVPSVKYSVYFLGLFVLNKPVFGFYLNKRMVVLVSNRFHGLQQMHSLVQSWSPWQYRIVVTWQSPINAPMIEEK